MIRRKSSLVHVLVIVAVVALGFAAFFRTHPLVSMTNDKLGSSVFHSRQPDPRGQITGDVTIGNDGLLPYTLAVDVSDVAAGEHLQITRWPDRHVLYSGPPPDQELELGRLEPGQRMSLLFTLTGKGSFSPVTLQWNARGSIAQAIPWALFIALGGLIALAGVALLVRSRRPARTARPAAEPVSVLGSARSDG